MERQPFSGVGKDLVEAAIGQVADAVRMIAPEKPAVLAAPVQAATWLPGVIGLRERCLKAGAELSPVERGAVLALLGSTERAFVLIERIDAERRSVPRIRAAEAAAAQPSFAEVGRAVPQAI